MPQLPIVSDRRGWRNFLHPLPMTSHRWSSLPLVYARSYGLRCVGPRHLKGKQIYALFLKIPNMPSFDPSFDFSFSFSLSDFDLDELGMRFLASSCCQVCVAFSSSSMVYIWWISWMPIKN